MSSMSDPDSITSLTRTSQIIIAALIAGVVGFLAIVVIVIPSSAGKVNGAIPLITYMAAAMGLADLALSFVVPSLNAASARREIARETPSATTKDPAMRRRLADPGADAARLAPVYQTQLIIGAALLEGGAFFAAIAYMLERNSIALGMCGLLIGGLASRFPTRDRITAWLDTQAALLQEDRQSQL